MKKFIIALFVALHLIDAPILQAAEMWNEPRAPIQAHQLIFLHVRDEYQLRYAIGGLPQGTHSVRANFWTQTGTYYEIEFEQPTGIAYLTCNGTYLFEVLDAAGTTIAETRQIKTTKIQNPACSSYENGNLKNDLNMTVSDYENGGKSVSIPFNEAVASYDIYHDGEFFQTSTENPYDAIFQSDGAYTIIAKDANGNVIGSSDFVVGGNDEGLNNPDDSTGGGGEVGGGENGNNSSCANPCQFIQSVLDCPAWDEYMGEWKSMLQEVYQPPNWHEVANIMRDTIVPAIGDEILNKAPEVAKIFADEFTSREKQVEPAPTTPPTYEPSEELPQLTDLAEEIEFDLTSDIPDFTPNYSESAPFEIPNPLDLQLSDEDLGYEIQQVIEDNRTYEMEIREEDQAIPQYNTPQETETEIPNYQTGEAQEMPNYNVPNGGIRYYEGGE